MYERDAWLRSLISRLWFQVARDTNPDFLGIDTGWEDDSILPPEGSGTSHFPKLLDHSPRSWELLRDMEPDYEGLEAEVKKANKYLDQWVTLR